MCPEISLLDTVSEHNSRTALYQEKMKRIVCVSLVQLLYVGELI
jgi:hypothetical protein